MSEPFCSQALFFPFMWNRTHNKSREGLLSGLLPSPSPCSLQGSSGILEGSEPTSEREKLSLVTKRLTLCLDSKTQRRLLLETTMRTTSAIGLAWDMARKL